MNPYIKYFDVTMRDGLQSLSKIYTLQEKQTMLNKIMKKYNPHSLEIGSIVSPKLLPQMANSYELYNYAITLYNNNVMYNDDSHTNTRSTINNTCKFYLLVPPTKKYLTIAKDLNIRNISLITSVSDKFQQKNIKQSIQDTKYNIKECLKIPRSFDNVKLYISCITNCPVSGKQNKDHIIDEIAEYLQIDGINEICLSDTCGDIKFNDFKYIIDYLDTAIQNKKVLNKLSLHLHIKQNYNNDYDNDYDNDNNINNENINNDTEKIIEYAIASNIYKFDVSSITDSGGCSITFDDKTKMNGNLTYEKLYKILHKCNLYV